MSARARLRALAIERGAVIAALALGVYVWLAPTHIVAGDNAEFATLAAVGGRAHPSGYPLYVLWLRLWSVLPAASPAHAAAIATAVLAAAQVLVLHAACRAWGARAGTASLVVGILAACPIVLRVHTEADVFALNSLAGAAILWLSAPTGPLRGRARAGALGLVAGLALANNLTAGLLAPVGIYGLACALRETDRRARAAALAVAGLLVGLVPYAYLAVAPEPASYGAVTSLGDLVDLALRRDYGYTSHRPGAAGVPLSVSLGAFAELVGRSYLWIPAGLGVVGLVARCVRPGAAGRAAWIALGLTWLLVGPWFVSRLDVDPHGVGGYIGDRMQILSLVVLAVPVAAGLDLLADRLPRPWSPAVGAGLAVVGVVGLTAVALPRLERVHSAAVEAGLRNTLRAVPPDAILLVTSDDQCFGTRYLQLALGERPDVALVCWPVTPFEWYRARLVRAGVPIAPQRGGPATVAQGEALLATGRPLVVDDGQSAILTALPSYPLGVLVRVLPRGAAAPALRDVVAQNRALFGDFDYDYPRPERGDDFAAVAHLRYAHTWRVLAQALESTGDHAGAAEAAGLGAALAPE